MDQEKLIEAYTKALNDAVAAHTQLISQSQADLAATMDKAKAELESLVKSAEQVEEKPLPESAWVKDHLVLNQEAVELFQGLFKAISDLVPELKKLAHK
jgi:uncharacterized coiled-coil protein SlyX